MKISGNNINNIDLDLFDKWNNKFINVFNNNIAYRESETINEIDKNLELKFSEELILKGFEDLVNEENKWNLKFFKYRRIDIEFVDKEIRKEFPNASQEVFDILNDNKKYLESRLSIIKELLVKFSSHSYKEISNSIDGYIENSKKDIYSLSSYDDKNNAIILYDKAISLFAKEFNIELNNAYEIAYIQSLFIKYEYEFYIYNPKPIFRFGMNFEKYLGIILDLLKTYFVHLYLFKDERNDDFLNKIYDILMDNYLFNGGLRLKEFPYMGLIDFLSEETYKCVDKIVYTNYKLKDRKLGLALETIFIDYVYRIEKLLDLMLDELRIGNY